VRIFYRYFIEENIIREKKRERGRIKRKNVWKMLSRDEWIWIEWVNVRGGRARTWLSRSIVFIILLFFAFSRCTKLTISKNKKNCALTDWLVPVQTVIVKEVCSVDSLIKMMKVTCSLQDFTFPEDLGICRALSRNHDHTIKILSYGPRSVPAYRCRCP
jgi:hypothetical protein